MMSDVNKENIIVREDDKTSFNRYKICKRCFDFVSSLCALIIISWLLLIVAILIKCTSKGPVIFRDQRVGLNGEPFIVFKFRTMYSDAEDNVNKYFTEEQYKRWTSERKVKNDPRITPVGRFLRKSSIDELPQLLNIIKGEMSVVGPRPIKKSELEQHYTIPEQEKILSYRPGLTSIWVVYGRSNITYKSGRRQRMELKYIGNHSMRFDLKLIFTTIGSVIKGYGAQ